MATALRTIDASEVVLEDAVVDAFRRRVRGPLIGPDDVGYDDSRRLWNAMIDKRPGLVLKPSGTADIIDAVRFARDHAISLSIRGGGHNIAGTAVTDGGLMLDLSGLRGIRVDPEARTVQVQPGCVWGDVDRETQTFGLAVPNGIVSETGVAGLTLGGGFGWTTRRYGYTSDNLLAADVVTADGELRTASAAQNPDLFWGIRGGGGNFGVVTSFTFRAHPVGPEVFGGMLVYPMDRAAAVVDAFRALTTDAPDELSSLLVLRRAPPAPALPEVIHGEPVAIVAVSWTGPVDAGERQLGPLRRLGEPLADLIGAKPFRAIQSMLDAASPHGRRYYWKSDYFDALPDEAAEVLIEQARAVTSPQSAVLFMHLGGAANRLPEAHSAAGPRDVRYVLNVQGSWLDPAESAVHIRWVRGFWRAMRPFASGRAYMNFFTADEDVERLREAYGDATHAALARLKARYDPRNLFRLNQNIEPAPHDAVEADGRRVGGSLTAEGG